MLSFLLFGGKMNSNNQELATKSIPSLLFKLALPTVIAQLINMLYNVVDRIYIGHMEGVGSLALTGVGVCMPIILFVSAFASFSASGGAPRASISLGKNDKEKAESILGGCFTLQILISIVLTIIILIFNEPLLLFFGASSETITYATSYIRIYALGTIFVELTLSLNAFITCQGKTVVSMLTVLIGAVINIILDPIFIFVFNKGVEGAALATIISQGVSSLWCVLYLCSTRSELRLKIKNIKLTRNVVIPCLTLGISTFIMQSTESVISICFNSSLLKYGGDIAVGAMTICTSIMQMAMLPLQGIAQGAQPISSFNYGAGNMERVKKCFKTLLITCVTYTSILWLLVELFPSIFALIFTSDSSLVAYSERILRIYCFSFIILGIQIACQMTFVSIGEALSSVLVAVVRKLVLLIPLIYIVPLFFTDKTIGVFIAEPIADYIAVSFTIILFSFVFKKKTKKNRKE